MDLLEETVVLGQLHGLLHVDGIVGVVLGSAVVDASEEVLVV